MADNMAPDSSEQELDALRDEAARALRDGDFTLAQRLVDDGKATVEELVHNLRVYQSELEMQAHELASVNESLEGALHRFRRLFEMLPHAALVVDRMGTVQEFNAVARRMMESYGTGVGPTAVRQFAATQDGRFKLMAALVSARLRGNAECRSLEVIGTQGEVRVADVSVERLDGWREERFLLMLVDQTEHRRLSQRFVGIVDNAMDAILSIDGGRRIRLFNAAAEAVFGISAEAALGQPLDRFIPAVALAELQAALENADSGTGKLNPTTLWALRSDGQRFPAEVSCSQADVGERRLTLMIRDVTEREEALARLRESELRFRQVTESISEVFWLRDRKSGAWLHVSSAYQDIFGLPPAELKRDVEAWFRAVHQDDRERVRRYYAGDTGPGEIEYRINRPDGRLRWIRDHAEPVRDGDDATERLAGIALDVTREHDELEQIRLLESAIANLNDVVVITDLTPAAAGGPRIVFVNAAFERMTGYTAVEVVGQSPAMLQGADTDAAEVARYQAAVEGRHSVSLEVVNYRKDGTAYWVEVQATPVLDRRGHAGHMVAIQRDVTERRLATRQLQRAKRLESVGLLTGGIAHDFNNLLTVIQGNAELLAADQADGGDGTVAAILEATGRGADLTRQLLTFSGRQPLRPVSVDINDVLGKTGRLLGRTIGSNIEIETRLTAGPWNVRIDPSLFENALLNLCLNARDAMPDGGRLQLRSANVAAGAPELAGLALETRREYVRIDVEDSGHGIAPELQEHIFDPFFTTKGPGEGSGLGLAMVHSFVKQSGGDIVVSSDAEAGACFSLYLPRQEGDAERIVGSPPEDSGTAAGETVLLVEDDDHVRRYIEQCLRSLNYRVTAVADAASAEGALASGQPFDLLLSDIMLKGGSSGREVAAAAARLRPELPVLLMTGYDPEALGSPAGLPVLRKPFRRAELAAALGQLLTGSGAGSGGTHTAA